MTHLEDRPEPTQLPAEPTVKQRLSDKAHSMAPAGKRVADRAKALVPQRETVEHAAAVTGKHTVSFGRIWLGVFVGQGAYVLLMGAVMTLIVGSAFIGAFTWDAMLSGVLAVVAFLAMMLLSVFIVPLLVKGCVKMTAGVRVSFGWTFFANLAGWLLTGLATSLLWLIPGTQPLIAFLSLIGASAATAYLLARRAQ